MQRDVAIVCHMKRDVAIVCHMQRDVAIVCHMQRDVAEVCHMQRDVADVCHMPCECGNIMSHATCLWKKYVTCHVNVAEGCSMRHVCRVNKQRVRYVTCNVLWYIMSQANCL